MKYANREEFFFKSEMSTNILGIEMKLNEGSYELRKCIKTHLIWGSPETMAGGYLERKVPTGFNTFKSARRAHK